VLFLRNSIGNLIDILPGFCLGVNVDRCPEAFMFLGISLIELHLLG
jgi:hypothetical protein